MPEADDLEGLRRLAFLAFAELSQYDLSSSPPPADLPPLLRFCLLLLPLLEAGDPDLAARCGRRLLAFLRRILSRDPDPSLVPALEVFLENLVISDHLERCFTIADGAIPKGLRVSMVSPSCQGELRFLLDIMPHHFISSVQDEGSEQFLSALSWSGEVTQGTPEIGLRGAINLVKRVYWFSMPIVFQAHFLLLTSRCVSNGDLAMHLLAFEHAMKAYLRYLPVLGVFNITSGGKSPLRLAKKRRLNSCIQDTTNQKLSCQANRLLSICKLQSDDDLHINEKDIADISFSFIEENQDVVHEEFRQKAIIAMKSIVSNILGCAKQKEIQELNAKITEEIIRLAAVLRLMGSSFQQILHRIRQMSVVDGRKNTNYLVCKEYIFMSEKIGLLGQYEANELHRHDIFGLIGNPVDRERASVVMLAHFASLSVCCFRMRLDFLWKGCIIMMMMAMNLVIAEEDSVKRKSSTEIATQFKSLKKVHIRDDDHDFGEGSRLGTLQRCKSGHERDDVETFFQCLPEFEKNSTEWDGIRDFIHCEKDMNIARWWKARANFKKFKDKKFRGLL